MYTNLFCSGIKSIYLSFVCHCLSFTERKSTPSNICKDPNVDETIKLIERLKVNKSFAPV